MTAAGFGILLFVGWTWTHADSAPDAWTAYDLADGSPLSAFEVVSMDAYGATIAWRLLKTFDVPRLPQSTPPRPGEGGLGGGNR